MVTGRGVAVYISRHHKTAHQVHFSNSSFQEQLWIKIPLKGHDSLSIGCIIEVQLLTHSLALTHYVNC